MEERLNGLHLINREVISSNVLPVPGGDALWFINQYGCLCSITGSTLKRWLNLVSTQMYLAWNDNERELWIAGPDGKVQVLMPSGRCYARDLEVASLYSDSQHAMAVTQQGTLLFVSPLCA